MADGLDAVKIAAVARELNVSRSWASREENAPGTRILIADIFELRRERMNALCDQTLDVIEDAMKAGAQVSRGGWRSCRRRARSRHPDESGEDVCSADAESRPREVDWPRRATRAADAAVAAKPGELMA